MKILHRILDRLMFLLLILGGGVMIAMILLTNGNILLRLVWMPIRGTFELMGFCGAVVAAFALAYTQSTGGHISVDVLINTFTRRTRGILRSVNDVLCLLFFVLVAWQIGERAATLCRTGEVTETLRIIYYPFTYAVAFGFGVLALWFLVDLIRQLRPGKEESR